MAVRVSVSWAEFEIPAAFTDKKDCPPSSIVLPPLGVPSWCCRECGGGCPIWSATRFLVHAKWESHHHMLIR